MSNKVKSITDQDHRMQMEDVEMENPSPVSMQIDENPTVSSHPTQSQQPSSKKKNKKSRK